METDCYSCFVASVGKAGFLCGVVKGTLLARPMPIDEKSEARASCLCEGSLNFLFLFFFSSFCVWAVVLYDPGMYSQIATSMYIFIVPVIVGSEGVERCPMDSWVRLSIYEKIRPPLYSSIWTTRERRRRKGNGFSKPLFIGGMKNGMVGEAMLARGEGMT